jgi:hypothetical protein
MQELADIAAEIQRGRLGDQEWDMAGGNCFSSIGRSWTLWHSASVPHGRQLRLASWGT